MRDDTGYCYRMDSIRLVSPFVLLLASSLTSCSVVLPLWSPTQVSLGAIGYLQKPEGTFVTLFNAINPELASEFPDGLATVWGFGKVTAQSQRVETRTATQKGFDILAGMFNFRKTKEGEPTCVHAVWL